MSTTLLCKERNTTRVSRNRAVGLAAETLVAQKYVQSGFEVAERNYRVPHLGELDLVATAGSKLYFVECKSAATHAEAANHLSKAQRTRMHETALHYLSKNGLPLECDMRFDAALVDAFGRVSVLPGALN